MPIRMEGLLWFDDSGKPFEEMVRDAARAYSNKYGTGPDTCYANPEDVPEHLDIVDEITIISLSSVSKYHVWIGERNVHKHERISSEID